MLIRIRQPAYLYLDSSAQQYFDATCLLPIYFELGCAGLVNEASEMKENYDVSRYAWVIVHAG